MRNVLFARGITGALAIASLGIVGCGAEGEGYEGAAGEGEIGVSEQALTTRLTGGDDPTDKTSSSPDLRVAFASACTLTQTFDPDGAGPLGNVTKDFIIEAGGLNASLGPVNAIRLYVKGSAPVLQAATLSQPSASGQLVKVAANKCLHLSGGDGDDTGDAHVDVDELSLSFPGGVPTVTVSNTPANLNEARSNFMAGVCKDSSGGIHAWALGGQDNGTGRRSLEISNTAFSAWTKTDNVLSVDRKNFGADIDEPGIETDRLHIVAGGGRIISSGNRSQTLDLIKLDDDDCSFVSTTVANTANLMLPNAEDGNVIMYDQSIDKFVSAFGTFSSGGLQLETKVRTFTIDWATTVVSSVSDATAPTNFVGSYRPYVIRKDVDGDFVYDTDDDLLFVGGANAAISSSIAFAQKYALGATWTSRATSEGMYGATGGHMPTVSELWGINGLSDPSPVVHGLAVDAFTE